MLTINVWQRWNTFRTRFHTKVWHCLFTAVLHISSTLIKDKQSHGPIPFLWIHDKHLFLGFHDVNCSKLAPFSILLLIFRNDRTLSQTFVLSNSTPTSTSPSRYVSSLRAVSKPSYCSVCLVIVCSLHQLIIAVVVDWLILCYYFS